MYRLRQNHKVQVYMSAFVVLPCAHSIWMVVYCFALASLVRMDGSDRIKTHTYIWISQYIYIKYTICDMFHSGIINRIRLSALINTHISIRGLLSELNNSLGVGLRLLFTLVVDSRAFHSVFDVGAIFVISEHRK